MAAAIALDRTSIARGGRAVVADVVADVAAGEWLAVIGPNGAGKTTLLLAAAGLLPYGGSLALAGREVSAIGRRELARAVALVPQAPVIPAEMTVGDYVLLGRTPYLSYFGSESRADRETALRALRRLDLEELGARALGTLSGGERQRAVLARALAQEAGVLLLDEPTSALDIGRQQQVLELVDCLRGELGLTVVAAMHDLTLAAQFADRLLLLSAGRVVAEGMAGDVLTSPRIAEHYHAHVDVIEAAGGRVAVVPARASAREEAPWLP
jgi:iron complex transport system ATP-binding protein